MPKFLFLNSVVEVVPELMAHRNRGLVDAGWVNSSQPTTHIIVTSECVRMRA